MDFVTFETDHLMCGESPVMPGCCNLHVQPCSTERPGVLATHTLEPEVNNVVHHNTVTLAAEAPGFLSRVRNGIRLVIPGMVTAEKCGLVLYG